MRKATGRLLAEKFGFYRFRFQGSEASKVSRVTESRKILVSRFLFKELLMRFKNNLKSNEAQSIVEYITIFIVLAAAILAVFGAFNPETIGIRTVFDDAVSRAITQIQK